VQEAVRVPSQVPEQTDPSAAQAARVPWGAPEAAVQVPALPATSQASHCPLQEVSQQKPSTHWPVAHSLAAPQAVPWASLGTQAPEEQ
jgi:hypothetical protein